MERRVTVEGCLNFRDLGGYPTADGGTLRWRQLFRADPMRYLVKLSASSKRESYER